ncbi:MAG: RnfABCDGE type electron transport complex subunit D [Rikenellaceae bacterium]|jgi:electron transport complex protein RnfD|nr:RnfABCDGE type electron transport complex subunit D [Rikenellaceae bacterium]
MEKKLIVSPSPHVFSGDSTTRLMRDVLIALLPALAFSVVVYGLSSLLVTAVAVVSCVVFEFLIQKYLLKGSLTVGDYSAVLTGVLLAFNLPNNIPLGLVVLGSLVAIGIGKMTFGGLGRNVFNPALVGRVFLLIAFPVQMTSYPMLTTTDAVSGATPLTLLKEALKSGQSVSDIMPNLPSSMDMLLGLHAGSLGEIGALALILGFIYLLVRKVITWHIPVAIIATIALFSEILHLASPEHYIGAFFHVLAGGTLLGAIFMATDYVTSPMVPRAMIIYGVGIGVLTVLIRVFGAYPEGMSFAILIMNAVVPLLNKYIKPRRFGAAVKKA